MELKVKFDLGDYVWYMRTNKAEHSRIKEVKIVRVFEAKSTFINTHVLYKVEAIDSEIQIAEKYCYGTKQELLESL